MAAESSFERLPPEMVAEILSRVDWHTALTIGRVSWRLNSAAFSQALWRGLFRRQFPRLWPLPPALAQDPDVDWLSLFRMRFETSRRMAAVLAEAADYMLETWVPFVPEVFLHPRLPEEPGEVVLAMDALVELSANKTSLTEAAYAADAFRLLRRRELEAEIRGWLAEENPNLIRGPCLIVDFYYPEERGSLKAVEAGLAKLEAELRHRLPLRHPSRATNSAPELSETAANALVDAAIATFRRHRLRRCIRKGSSESARRLDGLLADGQGLSYCLACLLAHLLRRCGLGSELFRRKVGSFYALRLPLRLGFVDLKDNYARVATLPSTEPVTWPELLYSFAIGVGDHTHPWEPALLRHYRRRPIWEDGMVAEARLLNLIRWKEEEAATRCRIVFCLQHSRMVEDAAWWAERWAVESVTANAARQEAAVRALAFREAARASKPSKYWWPWQAYRLGQVLRRRRDGVVVVVIDWSERRPIRYQLLHEDQHDNGNGVLQPPHYLIIEEKEGELEPSLRPDDVELISRHRRLHFFFSGYDATTCLFLPNPAHAKKFYFA